MKKYLIVFLLFSFTALTFGQNNYQDVIYLKDGNIIRGVIIEQVPDKLIKIETVDRSVFVYRMDEIEVIKKESTTPGKITSTTQKRKGFIGLSIGASIPIGDFADKLDGAAQTGIQLNLINFGYLFSENIGVAATWFGASNPIDFYSIDPWSYGGLLAGPLLSFPASKNVDWDFKPMIGYSVTTFPGIDYITEQSTAFAFSVGTQLRFHVGKKISLTLSADYFYTNPEFIYYDIEQKIGTITIGVGVAFRLK